MRCPGDFDPRAAGLVFDHARGWHKPEPLGGNVFAQADAIGGREIEALRADRDALQSRLAAAEAERNEWKDIASVFLAATEPNQPIPVQGQIMLAQVRERARATFDAHLASRPEGEVRDGR